MVKLQTKYKISFQNRFWEATQISALVSAHLRSFFFALATFSSIKKIIKSSCFQLFFFFFFSLLKDPFFVFPISFPPFFPPFSYSFELKSIILWRLHSLPWPVFCPSWGLITPYIKIFSCIILSSGVWKVQLFLLHKMKSRFTSKNTLAPHLWSFVQVIFWLHFSFRPQD